MSLSTDRLATVASILKNVQTELAQAASLVGTAIQLDASSDTVTNSFEFSTAIASSVLHSGGSGYVVADTFTVNGGDTLATGQVVTVDGSGAVLTYLITDPGTDYEVGTNVATTHTSGSGTGFTINISTVSSTAWATLQAAIVTEIGNVATIAATVHY